MTGSGSSLGSRAVSGSVWAITGTAASQLIRFAGNLVLTRLLFEEVFGVMVIVNVCLQGLAMLSDIGINSSIIQNQRGDDPKFLDTAWTLQVIRGAVLGLVCLLGAPLVAGFYGYPELTQLIPVAGLSVLISGFNSTSIARLQRHVKLRQVTILELMVQVVSIVVMISWALISPSVWALVAGGISGNLFRMLASHTILRDRRDHFAWDPDSVAAMMTFGAWVLINTPLGFAADQSDRLALGKMIPLATLGVYQIAVMVGGLPYLLLVRVGGGVIFPVFSRAREENRDLIALCAAARLPILLAGAVLVAGLIGCGPGMVSLLWDERWHDAGWMLVPVAAGQWFRVLAILPGNTLFALGKPQWLVAGNSAKLLGYAIFVPIGYGLGGFLGALIGFAAGESLSYLLYAAVLRSHGSRTFLQDLGYTLLLAVLAASSWLLREAMVSSSWSLLSAVVAAGMLVVVCSAPLGLRLLTNMVGRR